MVGINFEPDAYLNKLVQSAAKICNTPMALISLITEDRQIFMAKFGVDGEGTPRNVAFCAYTVEQDGILVVADAMLDDRFRDNPFVTGEPFIRFYAGIPVQDRLKRRIGSVCIVDCVPQMITDTQMTHLRQLKLLVESRLFQRRFA